MIKDYINLYMIQRTPYGEEDREYISGNMGKILEEMSNTVVSEVRLPITEELGISSNEMIQLFKLQYINNLLEKDLDALEPQDLITYQIIIKEILGHKKIKTMLRELSEQMIDTYIEHGTRAGYSLQDIPINIVHPIKAIIDEEFSTHVYDYVIGDINFEELVENIFPSDSNLSVIYVDDSDYIVEENFNSYVDLSAMISTLLGEDFID